MTDMRKSGGKKYNEEGKEVEKERKQKKSVAGWI